MPFILPGFYFCHTISSTTVTQPIHSTTNTRGLLDMPKNRLEPTIAYESEVTGHGLPKTLPPISITPCLSRNGFSPKVKSHFSDDIYPNYLHSRAAITEPFSLSPLSVHSILNKAHALRLLVYTRIYDLILITGTWLTDSTPDRVIAIIGYNVFRKDGINKCGKRLSQIHKRHLFGLMVQPLFCL